VPGITSALAAVPVTGGAAGGGGVVLSGGGGVGFPAVGVATGFAVGGVATGADVNGAGDDGAGSDRAGLADAEMAAALIGALDAGADAVAGPGLTFFAEWPHAAVNSARAATRAAAAVAFGVRLMVHLRPGASLSGAE
jgi:hypothetical protein